MGRAVLLALVVALAGAAPAAAADVRVTAVQLSPDRYGDPSYAYVELHGAAGEANTVTVTRERDALVVRDAAAPLHAGPGCRARAPHEVVCRSRYPRLTGMRLYGGDGNDALTDAARRTYATLSGGARDDVLTGDGDRQLHDGGEGADRLLGGGGVDYLEGGPGADEVHAGDGDDRVFGDPAGPGGWPDVLDGGAGDGDQVGYDGRTTGVTVDLASPEPQGAAGEGDRLSGFEQAHGGEGPDTIRGTDGRNHLEGAGAAGPGDRLEGRGGNDTLWGSSSDDRLAGGPGDDRLLGRGGSDVYRAGAGNDRLSLELSPFADPRDRARAVLSCGPGRDFANDPDARAVVPPDCEEISFEYIAVRVRRAGPRRLVLGIRDLRTILCRLTVRVARPAGTRSLARRTVDVTGSPPRAVVLRWRRPTRGRVVVDLRGTYRCRPHPGRRLGGFALPL